VVVRVAFLLQDGVGVLNHAFFEAQSPRPLMPLSTLRPAPRDAARKTRGQDGFAVLLSRRALSSPTTCRFYPDAPCITRYPYTILPDDPTRARLEKLWNSARPIRPLSKQPVSDEAII